MLSSHLAELYDVEPKALVQAVIRTGPITGTRP